MNIKDTKTNILSQIKSISDFDFSVVNPESSTVVQWLEMDPGEISNFVNDVREILNRIYDEKEILNTLSPGNLSNLLNHLNALTSSYEALKSIPSNEVTDHHHGTLNGFNNLDSLLRSTGLYTQLKLTKNFDDINTKLKDANKHLKSFDIGQFEKAISLVEELNKKKVLFEEKTIKESLGTFLNRAAEHKIYNGVKFKVIFRGQWWWLLLALIMGGVIAYFVFSFINVLQNNGDISIGAAILRISSLAVPTYFMAFCVNQFKYHKSMYEIYSFKNTALNVMTDLMKTNEQKSDYILERGLKVLFTEPNLKNDNKYDRQIINDLMAMLNSQFNKN